MDNVEADRTSSRSQSKQYTRDPEGNPPDPSKIENPPLREGSVQSVEEGLKTLEMSPQALAA